MRKQLPFHKDKDFQQPNFFMHRNADCVNGEYCWVSRISIKMFSSVIREALHLLKTGKNFQVFKAANYILSAKLLHTNVNCDHSVKTNVPFHSIKKTDPTYKYKFNPLQYNPY